MQRLPTVCKIKPKLLSLSSMVSSLLSLHFHHAYTGHHAPAHYGLKFSRLPRMPFFPRHSKQLLLHFQHSTQPSLPLRSKFSSVLTSSNFLKNIYLFIYLERRQWRERKNKQREGQSERIFRQSPC